MIGSSQRSTCPDQIEEKILDCIFNQVIITRELPPVPEQRVRVQIINMGQRIFLALFKIFPKFSIARYRIHL